MTQKESGLCCAPAAVRGARCGSRRDSNMNVEQTEADAERLL